MLRISAPGMACVTGVSTTIVGLVALPTTDVAVVLVLAVALFPGTLLPLSLLVFLRLLVLFVCHSIESLVPPGPESKGTAIQLHGVQQDLLCTRDPAKPFNPVLGIVQLRCLVRMAPDSLTPVRCFDLCVRSESVDSEETIEIILEYAGLLIHAGNEWIPRWVQLTIQVFKIAHHLLDHWGSVVIMRARSLPEVGKGRIVRHLAKFGDKTFGIGAH